MNKNRICMVAFFLISVFLYTQSDLPDRVLRYRSGDWVGYPVLRYINSVMVGKNYVYFGTTGGVLRYHLYQKIWEWPFTESDGLENGTIKNLTFDFNTDFLWCATDAGISYREPASEYWRNIPSQSISDPVSVLGVGREFIWAQTGIGYKRIDRTTGFIWDATYEEMKVDDVHWNQPEGGLEDRYFMDYKYLIVEGKIQDIHLRQYTVTDRAKDIFQNLWLGTSGLGVGHVDLNMMDLDFRLFGPYASNIQAMAWDEHGMWMGGLPEPGTDHGITYWNMVDNTWHFYEALFLSGLRSDAVTAIVNEGAIVWFGTLDGLIRYDKERDEWRSFSQQNGLWDEEITCLALNDSLLWVGTVYGINCIDLKTSIIKKVRDNRLVHRMIYQVDVDDHGAWAGTDRGIYRYLAEPDKWIFMEGYRGMLTHTITAVSVFGSEVWFGTSDGIEAYNQQTESWTGFPVDHFPIEGEIYTILPDDQAVWFGTDNGVLKYIREEDRWRRFTTEDGLLDNEVRWILLDGDHIWFGTSRGLTRFYWNAPYRID